MKLKMNLSKLDQSHPSARPNAIESHLPRTSRFVNHQLKVGLGVLAILFLADLRSQDAESTNYKSGIDVIFQGVKGRDYKEEYLYFDKMTSDRKVVYIRSTTKIEMRHNEYNNLAQSSSGQFYRVIGANGLDGLPNSGDEGIIRYRIDMDYHTGRKWSGSSLSAPHFPAYSSPISFDQLQYEPGQKVLGSIGSNGKPITDRRAHYFRGLLDDFGDEWHVMTVADDDESIIPNLKAEYWSSDGKNILFVVDPKTPTLQVSARGAAQFYTTPAKAYYVPKIHEQVTYFTVDSGGIDIEIEDLFGNAISYRINSGTWVRASGSRVVLNDSHFSDGRNVLEYQYGEPSNPIKRRVFFKNPDFPSKVESHGNRVWGGPEELNKIKSRLTREPYLAAWNTFKRSDDYLLHNYWDLNGKTPHRWPWFFTKPFWFSAHPSMSGAAFMNSFIALIDGWGAKRTGAVKTYGEYAKEMMMNNVWARVDPIGYETNHSSGAHPSTEVIGAGYFMVGTIIDSAAAYDIIAGNFRSDQVAGGLTPIEDFYIRDVFGASVLQSAQWLGGIVGTDPGMWGSARIVGALFTSIMIPRYSNPVFGASGYGGTTERHRLTPYPDVAVNWYDLFTARNVPITGYPNVQYRFDPETNDLWRADGAWGGANLGYASLMKQTYNLLLNISAIHAPVSFPRVEKGLLNAVNGTLVGTGGGGPAYMSNPMLGNDKFGALGAAAVAAVKSRGAEAAELLNGRVWTLIWYDDTMQSAAGSAPSAPSSLSVTK